MTQEHTPEPWKIGAYGMVVARGEHGGIVIADVPRTDGDPAAEANARRIVACVNAFAGISTEAIEGGVIAELVSCVRDCADVLGPLAKEPNVNPWLAQANALLAKLEASK